MEDAPQSNAWLMRAGENCPISEAELAAHIESALAQDSRTGEFSISLGRLIKFPWLAQSLATAAARSADWDAKRGRAKNQHDNAVVGRMLTQSLSQSAVANALDRRGLRLVHVSVEKVLVSKQADGKLPFDAQLSLRVAQKS
ncbi:MAG: hypothetical protein HYS18_10860 [Burkholderiales bacterium]|nr:hypothetical protein [Burkholderiales bacterium]